MQKIEICGTTFYINMRERRFEEVGDRTNTIAFNSMEFLCDCCMLLYDRGVRNVYTGSWNEILDNPLLEVITFKCETQMRLVWRVQQ